MEYMTDLNLESDKQIFPKQEHCDNPESSINYSKHKNGVFNYPRQQTSQGDEEQRGNSSNFKQNLQQKSLNGMNDQSTINGNNISSTYDNSNHNYTLTQQQSQMNNDTDYFNHSYRNQQDNFQNSEEHSRNLLNQNNLTENDLNNEHNFIRQDLSNNQDSQKQPQNDKVQNIATYELQPEIKGMIVALKYIGVPNHKVVEEIGKLGFTVSESNIIMVWEEWTEERNKLGKSIMREQTQILKSSKGQYKKSNKVNRKFSGRQSSDEDDEELDYQDEDDEEDDDDEDSLKNYKIPIKGQKNKQQMNNRKQFQQSEIESESNEFNENTTPIKGQKYSQLIKFKQDLKNKSSVFDKDLNRQMSDELDFDSDYDESYKKKLNESRKQNIKPFEKQPKKQIKIHGDHILFYNLEAGQCVFCAQNNKENEVFTTCMECEGQGENKFFICEECFDINHNKPDQSSQNQQKQPTKNEDLEQPFMESDDSDLENNHQKNFKNKNYLAENHASSDLNQKNQGQNNLEFENNKQGLKEQKNDQGNSELKYSTNNEDENQDLNKRLENSSNDNNYELNLIERIQKNQLKVNTADDFAKIMQDNYSSPQTNKQQGEIQNQQTSNNVKTLVQQKKILKIYKNPQIIQ